MRQCPKCGLYMKCRVEQLMNGEFKPVWTCLCGYKTGDKLITYSDRTTMFKGEEQMNNSEKLSCETCKWHGNKCENSEPYEGKSGYTAGDDWCEFYVGEKEK